MHDMVFLEMKKIFVAIEFNTNGTKLFIYDKTGNVNSIKQYSLK